MNNGWTQDLIAAPQQNIDSFGGRGSPVVQFMSILKPEPQDMTVLHLPLVQERLDAADSGVAEELWDALYAARTGRQLRSVAELEDAAFTFYLPLARTTASLVYGESTEATNSAQQAAELGLARAILSWPHRTSSGFRRFARAVVIQQISDQAEDVGAGYLPLHSPHRS